MPDPKTGLAPEEKPQGVDGNVNKGDCVMPMGPGTYGSKRGRPPKKAGMKKAKLTAKQKTLPKALRAKIIKAKKK